MTDRPPRPVPPRITGLAHVFAATGYSLGGVRRLWRETAFRHEVLALIAGLGLLLILGAGLAQMAGLIGLFLLLFAVEALNTAVECIVDRLSPTWEEYARDAKDLGSLAVMCILLMIGLYLIVVVAGHLFGA